MEETAQQITQGGPGKTKNIRPRALSARHREPKAISA
jgi:hypothetical protein